MAKETRKVNVLVTCQERKTMHVSSIWVFHSLGEVKVELEGEGRGADKIRLHVWDAAGRCAYMFMLHLRGMSIPPWSPWSMLTSRIFKINAGELTTSNAI